jgi:glycosyltransferase involved in cell wall biosynthesis
MAKIDANPGPKVSVIVPTHNTERFVYRSLYCIRNQTLRDIEIIVIDDASIDNTKNKIREMMQWDDRIKLIEMEKSVGAGPARNAGIDIAAGEYIAVCDDDDWLDFDFYEKLYNNAKENNLDASGGNVLINGSERSVEKEYNHNPLDLALHWSMIYKRDFIERHHIRYPNIESGQDTIFLLLVAANTKSIGWANDTFFHQEPRLGSLYSRYKSPSKITGKIVEFGITNDILSASYDARFFQPAVYNDYLADSFVKRVIGFINGTTRKDLQLKLCEKMIDIFANWRDRSATDALLQQRHPKLAPYIISQDATGLLDVITAPIPVPVKPARVPSRIIYRLFGFIPLMRIRYNKRRNTIVFRLFGFFPILIIRKKG